jgi:hypothetical protein
MIPKMEDVGETILWGVSVNGSAMVGHLYWRGENML